jgi:hypothetical protein
VHGTAEISRRFDGSDWSWAAPPPIVSRPIKHVRRRGLPRPTVRMGALRAGARKLRRWSKRQAAPLRYLLMIIPTMLVVAALLAI